MYYFRYINLMVGLPELEKFEIGVNTLIRDGGGVISINDDVGTV